MAFTPAQTRILTALYESYLGAYYSNDVKVSKSAAEICDFAEAQARSWGGELSDAVVLRPNQTEETIMARQRLLEGMMREINDSDYRQEPNERIAEMEVLFEGLAYGWGFVPSDLGYTRTETGFCYEPDEVRDGDGRRL